MLKSGTRRPLALVGGLVVFSMVYAFAATLTVTSEDLSAGTDSVETCDIDGVTTSYTVAFVNGSGYEVDDVTVGGIAGACAAKDFSVTLADGSDAALGTVAQADASLVGSDDARTLTLDFTSLNVASSAVENAYVSITD